MSHSVPSLKPQALSAKSRLTKQINDTIVCMEKNSRSKKQVVPPLYEYIPYCADRYSKPKKSVVRDEIKRFYQLCNESNLDVDCHMASTNFPKNSAHFS